MHPCDSTRTIQSKAVLAKYFLDRFLILPEKLFYEKDRSPDKMALKAET